MSGWLKASILVVLSLFSLIPIVGLCVVPLAGSRTLSFLHPTWMRRARPVLKARWPGWWPRLAGGLSR